MKEKYHPAGAVADVEEALQAGIAIGGDMLINYLFLPYIHRDVMPALNGATEIKEFNEYGPIFGLGELTIKNNIVTCEQ